MELLGINRPVAGTPSRTHREYRPPNLSPAKELATYPGWLIDLRFGLGTHGTISPSAVRGRQGVFGASTR